MKSTMKSMLVKCLAPAALLGVLAMPLASQADPSNPHSINGRIENQHDRIQQGVKNGSLTRREQLRLNERESRIRTQEYRDRLSGGKFTKGERRQIQRELNGSNHAIYRRKHDTQNY